MKLTKTLAIAISAIALTVSVHAAKLTISEQLARDYAKAVAQDAKQDASGQAKLDRIWAEFIKKGLIPAGTPNPLVYEGSAQDMKQDAQLNKHLLEKFQKAGVPFNSPIT
jgi:hypothetical protein